MGNIIHGVNYDAVKNTAVEQQYTLYTCNSSLRLFIRLFSVFLTSSFHSVPVEERSLQVSGLYRRASETVQGGRKRRLARDRAHRRDCLAS